MDRPSSYAGAAEASCRGQAFRFLAISPLERPDLPLLRRLLRQGVAVALDIGRDAQAWPALFAELAGHPHPHLGLRIPDGVDLRSVRNLPKVAFVIADVEDRVFVERICSAPLLLQVCSRDEARQAVQHGVAGILCKGQEAGGRVGAESGFVLLQGVLDVVAGQLPVWMQGGVGIHSSAAAFAGGAFGVVLDTLLAALPESSLPAAVKAQILAMDGSESVEMAGMQVCWAQATGPRKAGLASPAQVRQALAQGLLWPLGQDAALVAVAMAHAQSLESLLRTLRHHVAGQWRQAQAQQIFQENSAWAQAHGVRYPIAQGPMTRVSDEPAFCAAVGQAGALPFLALSLLDAPSCERLLKESLAALDGRPLGVGVLGFAPASVLEPQLALLERYPPAALLIAGGRPAQAQAFLARGIPAYLHVPSPGLLDLYLQDGARHFVFEGRECGGHVGPRYSWVLWEQAVQRLLQLEDVSSLHLLFAGGIHDERSAAMLAVMVAPLAALGARIGMLMGSAYIATEEAVQTGAILAEFQAQALACEETVLVETAPGHAIRCLPTSFVAHFEACRHSLEEQGVDVATRAEKLEALTLGRLRLASKGLQRQEGVLTAVDVAQQREEGMYMLGQLIALRRKPTTLADLHAAVTTRAMHRLAEQAMPLPPAKRAGEAIAIVGMACIYPGSPDLESYWTNIVTARDLVSEVQPERWNSDLYYRPEGGEGYTPSRCGGFIDAHPFDPLAFGIPPQSLAAIEPVQLLALQVAARALADAGYQERYFDREKTAVIFGAEAGMELSCQYNFRHLYPQYLGALPAELDQALPRLSEDSFPGVLVNVIAGRIANRLGLGGANYAVDAACASSLNAVDLAVKELRAGSSDMVLAGGADFHNGIVDYLMFASVGALSAQGRCRSFDAQADGIALGEGVGVVVLKRLSDAQADGDRIYALIEGVAASSDGRGLGLTAPRREGQRLALQRAYEQAARLPADIGLVEAHGTGTVVGDRTELLTLSEVYNGGGALSGQCTLGSVKSQIGHTKCAAGIAGLIKVAKALHHRVLPPTLHVQQPNPGYRSGSPFLLTGQARPWVAAPHAAAVSAFGFGGANVHAVLSAYEAHSAEHGALDLPAELFVVRGADRAQALAQLRTLQAYLQGSDAPLRLADVAWTQAQAGSGEIQCAFVARDLAQLRAILAQAESSPSLVWRQDAAPGRIAVLFPGQGSQYPGMLADLILYAPPSSLASEQPLWSAIFPPTAYDAQTRQAQERHLTDTRQAQPALALVEMAAWSWLSSFGLQPDMAAGHSFGELVALAAAGVCDEQALLRLARARAEAIMQSVGSEPGGMAAVALAAEPLAELLREYPGITLANHNAPRQTVIAGARAELAAACAFLQSQQIAVRTLPTACAFHTPLLAQAPALLAAALQCESFAAPRFAVYSNGQAQPHAPQADALRQALARHVVEPVRFAEEIEAMYAAGARVFVEVGPRRVLSGLVQQILAERPHQVLSLDSGSGRWADHLQLLAELAVICPQLDFSALWQGRAQTLDLQKPAQLPASTWMVDGGRAWPLHGELPALAGRLPVQPLHLSSTLTTVSASDLPLLDYLGNMREVVKAQRDVLLSYLGSPLPAAPLPSPAAARPSAPVAALAAPSKPAARDAQALLLAIVAARTGYPQSMLELDLDLEADLSIDSIKRTEIIAELVAQWCPQQPEAARALREKMVGLRTLRSMLAVCGSHVERVAPLPAAELLLQVISACTGYPLAALEGPLDLEADLSIDSIKRTEILGRLAQQLVEQGQLADPQSLREGMAGLKTLQQMQEGLQRHLLQPQPATTAPARVEQAPPVASVLPLTRYLVKTVEIASAKERIQSWQGCEFVITDDGRGLAQQLGARLQALGAAVDIIDFHEHVHLPEGLQRVDGLIHLWPLHVDNRVRDVKRFFEFMREPVLHQLRHLLVASGLGGGFGMFQPGQALTDYAQGAGLSGLIKSVAQEMPELAARWVDLDLQEDAGQLVDHLLAELVAERGYAELAYRQGRRHMRAITAIDLNQEESGLPLDAESVVLITGGARGITARIAIALAQRYHCRLELLGRSAAPGPEEDEWTRGVADPVQLRTMLAGKHPAWRPAEIEAQVRSLLAAREHRQTLAEIKAAGARVRYSQIDVRDIDAFASLIEQIYAEHGRIDGVIHGAGVIEDRLLRDKSVASFERVFDTKVRGALVLHKLIRDDVRFVVFFSSVAGAFGNRGQIDYAAANDVLDKIAHVWQSHISGRVLSVNWGPWADTGMVSEALEREYRRKGIGLIAQDEGVAALLRELAQVDSVTPQVVLMCGQPESFSAEVVSADA